MELSGELWPPFPPAADAEGGFVSLVGAGPGDPGLLTVKGLERLRGCDAVVYDRLVTSELLDLAPPEAERIFIGKAPGRCVIEQGAINDLLVMLGRQGKRVVRLKGGDPFVFGRGGEEAGALATAGISFEIVPGISSAIAAPAYAGIPVTDRRHASSFAVVTGHRHPLDPSSTVDWSALAAAVDTLVVLMGMKHLPAIAEALITGGRSPGTPAAVVSWGTHPGQRTVAADLSEISAAAADASITSPAVIVVGEVVRLSELLTWFQPEIPAARS
jgi:uroporphyrinogen III methyltransferase/synthase